MTLDLKGNEKCDEKYTLIFNKGIFSFNLGHFYLSLRYLRIVVVTVTNPSTRHCAKYFACIMSLNLHNFIKYEWKY